MKKSDYLKLLVDDIHSVVIASIDSEGRPTTRVIDMMYQDSKNVYFLTANTKAFYKHLKENPYISVTGMTQGNSTMERKMISLSGKAECIGREKLNILLDHNPYMYDIYPTEDGRKVLEVFCFAYARGEFYDLTVLPPRIDSFEIKGE
ncbi:pyridoxamine 5'-phosphate oxidase family protein [Streptococcus orisasini]|uniref:pyridoxamine 5'-phosphate oxidase family protein n=1 Tax=Streptococcus orisasini TaxID=1080071 RepID=UPI00070A1B69|nr:pyridoxamine 5'-phosphate oxidase family protein [Streptococcus orisasini]